MARDNRGQETNNEETPTHRTAGTSGATGSSTCPALSLAADAVSFHARQPVAAERLWGLYGSKGVQNSSANAEAQHNSKHEPVRNQHHTDV